VSAAIVVLDVDQRTQPAIMINARLDEWLDTQSSHSPK